MSFALSRRSLIGGASVGTAILASGAAGAAPRRRAEAVRFGPAPGIAQLSRNENPYGPSPTAVRAIVDTASSGCYYPDRSEPPLVSMIAERFGVGADQVALCAGSTEMLAVISTIYAAKGAIVAPELFYAIGVNLVERRGAVIKRVPLGPDMGIDLDAMAAAITPDVSLVQICNPNNPTGMILTAAQIAAFMAKVPSNVAVLVDEAYNELTDDPGQINVTGLIATYPNLITCRTFSKIYGLAGLRIGYGIASPEVAAVIRAHTLDVGISVTGLAAATASFGDTTFETFSREKVFEARAIIYEAVARSGLTALPSQTNFVYVKVADANAVQRALEARGVLIRGSYGPQWTQWSRVSTGYIEDVRRYAAALPEAVGA